MPSCAGAWRPGGRIRASVEGSPTGGQAGAGRRPGRTWLLGPAVAVLLAGWLLAGLWGPGLPSGDDTVSHLVRAEQAIQELLPRGKVSGWQSRFGVGYQQFLFYSPGFTWLVAVLHWLSLGLLSIPGAFKVAAALTVLALPPSVAFLARSLDLSRWAAGLAAILVLCVNSPFGGVGLHGTFDIGLLPNQLGAACFCLALGGMLRVVADPSARRVTLAGLALAGLLLTHAVTAIVLAAFLAVLLPTFLVTDRPGARGLARVAAGLLGAGALAAGLAAFWLVPALAHSDLRGPLTSWANPTMTERLGDILSGRVLFTRVAAGCVLLGWVLAWWRAARGRRWAAGLLLTPLAYLVVADLFLRWDPTNPVSLQLMNRGLGYVGVFAVLPLAAVLGGVASVPRWPWWRYAGPAVALACAVGLAASSGAEARRAVGQQQPTPALRAMAAELARVVPPTARFATQRDYPEELASTGVSHPDFWLPWAAGRSTLNIDQIESTAAPRPASIPAHLTDRPAGEVADDLLRLGVTHVAVVNEESAGRLLRSPRFRTVWSSPPLAVLAVQPRAGGPEPGALVTAAGPARARLVRAEPERLEFQVDSRAPTTVTAAVGWSPKWRAALNGRPVPLERTWEGLMAFPVPAGTSHVRLEFHPDGWDRLGWALTALTLAGLGGWCWRRRRAPEPPARASASAKERRLEAALP